MSKNLVDEVAKAIDPEEGYWQHFRPEAQRVLAVFAKWLREDEGVVEVLTSSELERLAKYIEATP